MVNIPDHVINQGNEGAYVQGAIRKMAANAFRTHMKRIESEPAYKLLIAYIERKADADRSGTGFFSSMAKAINEYGKLSVKQEAACARIMAEEQVKLAEILARDGGSEFVGSEKERRSWILTITGYRHTPDSEFSAESHFHAMKDEAGNVVIYSGSVHLGAKGDTVSVIATVKKHLDRNGVKTTYVARPKKI